MADALGAAAKARRQNTPRKETGNAPAPDQVETRSGHLVVRAAAIADPRGVDVSVKPRTLIEQALGCDFVRERFVVGAGAGTALSAAKPTEALSEEGQMERDMAAALMESTGFAASAPAASAAAAPAPTLSDVRSRARAP